MAHKTKAQKIAVLLRSKNSISQEVEKPIPAMGVMKENGHSRKDGIVYNPRDLTRTLVTTGLVVAFMALVFVLQLKGYF